MTNISLMIFQNSIINTTIFLKKIIISLGKLFPPDSSSKKCDECKIEFKNCRLKKNHDFLVHHQQTGGSMNQQLQVNILRKGPVIYYSINFQQHIDFHNFYDEKISQTWISQSIGTFYV